MVTTIPPAAPTSSLDAVHEQLAPSFAFDSTWLVHLSLIAQDLVDAALVASWQGGRALPAAAIIDEAMTTVARASAAGGRARPHALARPWGLTPREIEVLRLLAVGHADREIAAALFISHRTVHHHVAKVYAKLGVNSRAAAAHLARGAGLVDERSAPPQ